MRLALLVFAFTFCASSWAQTNYSALTLDYLDGRMEAAALVDQLVKSHPDDERVLAEKVDVVLQMFIISSHSTALKVARLKDLATALKEKSDQQDETAAEIRSGATVLGVVVGIGGFALFGPSSGHGDYISQAFFSMIDMFMIAVGGSLVGGTGGNLVGSLAGQYYGRANRVTASVVESVNAACEAILKAE